MLSEFQCTQMERALTENVSPRKVALYLCLHMGLGVNEVTALRWKDIDFALGQLHLTKLVVETRTKEGGQLVPMEDPRTIAIPAHVQKFLREASPFYQTGEAFIASGTETLPTFYSLQNILTSLSKRYKLGTTVSAIQLRNAFIRRCLENDMDLYDLCRYLGVKQQRTIVSKFEQFIPRRTLPLERLEQYAPAYAAPTNHYTAGPRRMNLLILGAGSQGPVVKEIAEAIGIFEEIAFLDDDPNNPLAIGPLADCSRLQRRFPMAIASFGDSQLRKHYIDLLESLGYVVPTLKHPSATISPSAVIDRSVVIEARCIISANTVIGRGAIISSAAVIEAGAKVGDFSHIGASATVAKNEAVAPSVRIPAGSIVRKSPA